MSEKGTPLYLQVEEALEAFKTGISRLRDQQSQTDSLLAKGNEALDNLVEQVTRIDKMQEDVEADLRLVERFRENADKERSRFHEQVLEGINQHQEQTKKALNNLRTDLSIRRQELLGVIRDLDDKICTTQVDSQNIAREFTGQLQAQTKAARALWAEWERKIQDIAGQCEDLAARVQAAQKKILYLSWAISCLAILAILALIL